MRISGPVRGLPSSPRIGGLSRSTSGDLHSKFAGLGVARNVSGSRRPAFANSQVYGADGLRRPAGQGRRAPRCWRGGGQTPSGGSPLLLSHRRHSGRQPWRLLDTAESGSHGESAASASGRRTNQTGCTNLTTANFADLVRAAQAGRAGSPRPKWLPPESSPCRRHTKGRETRCFARQPPREARPSSAARRWPF